MKKASRLIHHFQSLLPIMSEPSALFQNWKKMFYKDFVQHFDLQGTKTLAGATFQSDYFIANENPRTKNLVFCKQKWRPHQTDDVWRNRAIEQRDYPFFQRQLLHATQ